MSILVQFTVEEEEVGGDFILQEEPVEGEGGVVVVLITTGLPVGEEGRSLQKEVITGLTAILAGVKKGMI